MKEFNTTATCIPSKHYMVDITERVMQIKKMIDKGKYFTINRARQYGKTTTIATLAKLLQSEYTVISTSFEGIGDSGFEDEETFVKAFCRKLKTDPANGSVRVILDCLNCSFFNCIPEFHNLWI